MSLTSKQIDELRAYAKDRKGELAKLINDAADTIEMLSEQSHRMKFVQQSVNTIMSTSRSYSIRDRAFRNAARLVQCAIDGEAPDFEQIPEGDEMPSEPHWIPVSERLPEEPYGCLVTVWDTNLITMDEFENILPYFVGWDGEQWNDCDGEQCPFEVIAWMPVPSVYREEGEK